MASVPGSPSPRAAQLLITSAVLAFFAPVVVGRCFFLKDTQLVVYPMRMFLREQLLRFDLPHWLPGLDLGMPFLANPSNGVLYPLNVMLLLPAPWCIGAFVLCHSLLAGLGALLLLRSLGTSLYAALLGAVCFALGGYMVSLTWIANYMMSLAWLPLVLWFARRTLRHGKLGDAALCGVMWSLQLLSGEPQGVVMTGWTVLAFAAGYPLPWRIRLRRVALLGLALGIALVLAMPQVLPALELIPRSRRAAGIALTEASHWSLHPLRLLELCVPWLFGNPLDFGEFLGYFMDDEGGPLHRDPWIVTPYFGLLALILVVRGAWAPRRRHRHWVRSLGALAVFALLLALGRHTPVFGAYFDLIPGAQLFRYPAKFFGLCATLLPLLAAAGGDAWLRTPLPRFERAVAASVLVAMLLALAASGVAADGLRELRPDVARDPADTLRWALGSEALTFVLLALGLVWVRKHRSNWLGAALLGASALQVARANFDAYQTVSASVYQEPALARAIREATPAGDTPRIFHDVTRLSLPDLETGPAERRAQALSSSLLHNTGLAWGVSYARSYASSEEGPKFRFWQDSVAYRRALLDIFSIQHVILPSEAALPEAARLKRLLEFDVVGAAVYQNREALPFAFPVAQVGVVDTFEQATLALKDPRVARGELAVLGPLTEPLPNGSGAAGKCQLRGPPGDTIDLECDLTGASWVVVNESHHPNWTATVDGQSTSIVPANALVMATPMPAGKHRLKLEYEESSFGVALWVSLFGAVLCALLVVRDLRPRG